MGLAPGGNLTEQNKIAPFTNRETVLILRQMLDALVFLHVGQGIIHRDIKFENILCDSREHFRLADFGVAKEGYFLGSKKGTKPFMAPEMFLNQPYTSAVDVYALGLVIAQLLTSSYPQGYKVKEGPRWCKALVTHFKQYEERTREVSDMEQVSLIALVGKHMLRMKPEDRESASGCLERGDFLWLFSENKNWVLNHGINSEGHQNMPFSSRLPLNDANERSKNIELTEKHEPLEEKELGSEGESVLEGEDNECLGDQDSTEEDSTEEDSTEEDSTEEDSTEEDSKEDVDTEAVTEVRSLNTDEWLSLEREHPVNENEGRLVPQHFIDRSFIDGPENTPEHSGTLPDSDGQSGPEPSQRKRNASPAAPSAVGVRKQSKKRKLLS